MHHTTPHHTTPDHTTLHYAKYTTPHSSTPETENKQCEVKCSQVTWHLPLRLSETPHPACQEDPNPSGLRGVPSRQSRLTSARRLPGTTESLLVTATKPAALPITLYPPLSMTGRCQIRGHRPRLARASERAARSRRATTTTRAAALHTGRDGTNFRGIQEYIFAPPTELPQCGYITGANSYAGKQMRGQAVARAKQDLPSLGEVRIHAD